jgi:hypothetical protein
MISVDRSISGRIKQEIVIFVFSASPSRSSIKDKDQRLVGIELE